MKGVEDEDSKNTDDITFSTQTGPAWAGSERDYTYDEVNGHIYYWTCHFRTYALVSGDNLIKGQKLLPSGAFVDNSFSLLTSLF